MFGKQKIAALVVEFLGAAFLSLAILAMAGRTGFPFFEATIAGLTMALLVLVAGPISGAHINPIVTIGLWTMRKVQSTQAVVYIAAQMLGGIAAWQLSEFLLDRPLTNIAGSSMDWRVLIAEAIGAMLFTLAVAASVSRAYDVTKTAFVNGAGLAIGMLVASFAANGIINPSVAVGLQSWSWTYALGPVVGSVIGMNLYGMLLLPSEASTASGTKSTSNASVAKAKKSTSRTASRAKRTSKTTAKSRKK